MVELRWGKTEHTGIANEFHPWVKKISELQLMNEPQVIDSSYIHCALTV